jgi:hypothetical protein
MPLERQQESFQLLKGLIQKVYRFGGEDEAGESQSLSAERFGKQ